MFKLVSSGGTMRLSYAARLALCVLALSATRCGDDDDTDPAPDGSSDGADGDGSGDGSGDGAADGDADGSGDGDEDGDGSGDGSGDADPNELPPPTTSGIPTTTQL